MDQKSSGVIELVLMGAALFVGWSYTRNIQALRRNRYLSREDCECDYGPGACSLDNGTWFGPWYMQDAQARRRDPRNPGPGRFFDGAGSSGCPEPSGTEDGYRYGFGGSARRGSAGG
jgi:hypothetical protein